jgi:hypothetical protein
MRYILFLLCFVAYSVTAQTHIDWATHPNFDANTRAAFDAHNDCSVIALAIACDIPYHRSFWLHRDYLGRECAQCYTHVDRFYLGIGAVLNELHLSGNIIVRPDDPTKITVRQLALTVQDQYIYVGVDGHALAIVNGMVFDNAVEPALDMIVKSAFTIQRLPPSNHN